MPTNPSPTANLPCELCKYLNEPERVYCHNCGAKLDRSLLPKGEEKKAEPPEKARKRIAKMTNPQSAWVGREVKMLLQVTLYAALVAAVILIAQKPDGVPDPKGELADRVVGSVLMEALEAPAPRTLAFTETEANQHLKNALKAKEGMIPGVQFVRAFVNFRPGAVRVSTENSVWGYPVFSGVDHRVEVKDGKFVATVVGGSFGRLAVHPQAMSVAGFAFQQLWVALKRERQQMDRMQSIRVEEKRIELVTKGAAAAPR